MTTISVARLYRFAAQHHVPGLAEPWCSPHWHEYTVEVEASAPVESIGEDGIVIDTDALDAAWAELAPRGDDLNAEYSRTTVEALAIMWFAALRDRHPEVAAVTVWEDDIRWGRARA